MKTHPRKVAAESIEAVEVFREELKKRASKLRMGDPFDVDLRRYEDEEAKDKGDHESLGSLTDIPTIITVTYSIVSAHPGEDEE